MKRRNFIKSLGVIGVGLSFSQTLAAGLFDSKIVSNSDGFSLSILTGNTTKALKLAENFIKSMGYTGSIKVDEYQIMGEFVSDAVFVSNGKLVNFREDNSASSIALSGLSKELNMPSKVFNPFFIKLTGGADKYSKGDILILREEKLVKRVKTGNNTEVSVEGHLSASEITVHNSGVFMKNAPCNHKTCIAAGAISAAGESIVCIPNRLRIVIEGIEKDSPDVISR
ncbi:MAG: NusG domain II-containing protein [Ignavibacteriaceae bacterium]|nr:NusG domain II-containing protein [Ignavibacteriaceae bacterium]